MKGYQKILLSQNRHNQTYAEMCPAERTLIQMVTWSGAAIVNKP